MFQIILNTFCPCDFVALAKIVRQSISEYNKVVKAASKLLYKRENFQINTAGITALVRKKNEAKSLQAVQVTIYVDENIIKYDTFSGYDTG